MNVEHNGIYFIANDQIHRTIGDGTSVACDLFDIMEEFGKYQASIDVLEIKFKSLTKTYEKSLTNLSNCGIIIADQGTGIPYWFIASLIGNIALLIKVFA